MNEKNCTCGRVASKAERNEGTKLIGQMTSSGIQYHLYCVDTWGDGHSWMFGAEDEGIKYCPWCGGVLPTEIT